MVTLLLLAVFLSSSDDPDLGHVKNARFLRVPAETYAPTDIVARFAGTQKGAQQEATRTSDHMTLVSVTVDAAPNGIARVLELSRRKAESSRFWALDFSVPDTTELEKQFVEIEGVRNAIGGISIPLSKFPGRTLVVGEYHSLFIGNPSTNLWSEKEFRNQERQFERLGGALLGAILILAAFSALIAILNRDGTFLLFTGWLLCNYRIATVNGGWDVYWFGLSVQPDTYLLFLRVTLAAYGLFIFGLYQSIFPPDPAHPRIARTLRAVRIASVGFMVAAPFVPQFVFTRSIWVVASVGLATIAADLYRRLRSQPTRVAYWYSFTWWATIAGILSEILSNVSPGALPTWLNSQSSAIVAALLMSITLAERIRTDGTHESPRRAGRYPFSESSKRTTTRCQLDSSASIAAVKSSSTIRRSRTTSTLPEALPTRLRYSSSH